jgi:phosphate transport system substrate-binding protein
MTTKRICHLGAALLLVSTVACSKKKDDAADKGDKVKEPAGETGEAKPPEKTGGIVKVDGSSTVFPISEAVAEEFRSKGDATVAASGTGGGFKKFCRGELDVTGASRPIKQGEADECKAAGIEFIELPVAYDGLAVVVNTRNDWVDHLTVAELKKMWEPEAQDKVTNWSQIRDGFPDKKLVLFGAGTDSGTYDYFTQATVGKEHSSRGDYTSSEDDNTLVQGVSGDGNALGFFGFAYYTENKDKLKLIPIDDGKDDNGKGPISPSLETVADGTYQPLSRPLFIYVSVKSLDKGSVASFVAFYIEQAKTLSAEVGYIPLPDKAYELVQKRFDAKKTGSVFSGGSQIGMTIEKLLESEGS